MLWYVIRTSSVEHQISHTEFEGDQLANIMTLSCLWFQTVIELRLHAHAHRNAGRPSCKLIVKTARSQQKLKWPHSFAWNFPFKLVQRLFILDLRTDWHSKPDVLFFLRYAYDEEDAEQPSWLKCRFFVCFELSVLHRLMIYSVVSGLHCSSNYTERQKNRLSPFCAWYWVLSAVLQFLVRSI